MYNILHPLHLFRASVFRSSESLLKLLVLLLQIMRNLLMNKKVISVEVESYQQKKFGPQAQPESRKLLILSKECNIIHISPSVKI